MLPLVQAHAGRRAESVAFRATGAFAGAPRHAQPREPRRGDEWKPRRRRRVKPPPEMDNWLA